MFPGFANTDFAAYEEKKWGSNAYTLERIKVKEKFQRLQAVLQPVLGSAEVAAHLSDEHPNIVNNKRVDAQWLYYCRGPQAAADLAKFLEKTELRPDKIFNLAPQEKHVVLALVLDRERFVCGLQIHAGAWVDRRNLAAKLEHSWDREKFAELLRALGESVSLGFGDESLPVAEVTLATLEGLTEQLRSDERPFYLGQRWTAEEAKARGPELGEDVARLCAPLLPMLEFAQWTRANDHIAVGEKIRQEKIAERKNATEFRAGDKVRILGGLFSGKAGVVQAIDSKAQVKVQVGPLAVTVAANELARA
jgi:hypothetical protein